MLAELLDQLPFNLAIADLYKTRFNGVPGVVYAAGVRHAYNVAAGFRDLGMKAQAVSGETPKRELAQILARYERGDIDVLVNAQLLAEGWNSPRATVCMHLAPTASKRIYQQRVGRVTRRHPGKEAGIVVDFVHPATKHDDPVVTLHSLLDRDVYRGGAIVVGPVRRGRGRRLRVERRVLPVTSEENRRIEVFERELWRIAVEHLDYGEQVQWAALAGARVAPTGWRRARAMLHFDQGGELKRTFLITAVDRNKNPQLRLRALQEIASGRDAEAFDRALDFVESWPRDDKREGVKVVLQALAEKKIGRRDQANNWIWRCANMTREVHEEYAVQRWPETKRLLGPARELVRRRPCAQRAPAGASGAAAGPASVGRAAGRRDPAHRRGGRGHQRRPDPDVPQAGRAGAGAAAQLPEGPRQGQAPPSPQGRGGRDGSGRRAGRRGQRRACWTTTIWSSTTSTSTRRRRRRGPRPLRRARAGRAAAARRRRSRSDAVVASRPLAPPPGAGRAAEAEGAEAESHRDEPSGRRVRVAASPRAEPPSKRGSTRPQPTRPSTAAEVPRRRKPAAVAAEAVAAETPRPTPTRPSRRRRKPAPEIAVEVVEVAAEPRRAVAPSPPLARRKPAAEPVEVVAADAGSRRRRRGQAGRRARPSRSSRCRASASPRAAKPAAEVPVEVVEVAPAAVAGARRKPRGPQVARGCAGRRRAQAGGEEARAEARAAPGGDDRRGGRGRGRRPSPPRPPRRSRQRPQAPAAPRRRRKSPRTAAPRRAASPQARRRRRRSTRPAPPRELVAARSRGQGAAPAPLAVVESASRARKPARRRSRAAVVETPRQAEAQGGRKPKAARQGAREAAGRAQAKAAAKPKAAASQGRSRSRSAAAKPKAEAQGRRKPKAAQAPRPSRSEAKAAAKRASPRPSRARSSPAAAVEDARPSHMDVAGKVVVVTGGASGIGRALAYRFADDGAEGHRRRRPRPGGRDRRRDRPRTTRSRSAATSPTRAHADVLISAAEQSVRPGRPLLRQRGRRRRRRPGHPGRLGSRVRRQRPRPHRRRRAAAARLAGARQRLLPHDRLGGGHRVADRLRALRGDQARRGRLRRVAVDHLRRPRRRRQLPVPDGRQHAAADDGLGRRGRARLPRRRRGRAGARARATSPTPSSTASRDERFLILPHPEVLEFFQRKAADYDRWLAGMRRLQARVEHFLSEADLHGPGD